MKFIELTHDNVLLSYFHWIKNSVSFGTGLNIFIAICIFWIRELGTSTKRHNLRKSAVYEKIAPKLNKNSLFYTALTKGRFGIALKIHLNFLTHIWYFHTAGRRWIRIVYKCLYSSDSRSVTMPHVFMIANFCSSFLISLKVSFSKIVFTTWMRSYPYYCWLSCQLEPILAWRMHISYWLFSVE